MSEPVTVTPTAPATSATGVVLPNDEQMREALKEIFDPEIPINIVDLGLIYKLNLAQDGKTEVDMTLTSPHCPVGDQLKARVCEVLGRMNGITAVNVTLVFDPVWNKDKMTFEGKLQASMLGIM